MDEMKQMRMRLHRLIRLSMRKAGWQETYEAALSHIKREYLQRTFQVESSTQLNDEQLALAITAWQHHIKLHAPSDKNFSLPTQQELKKIVRLGKYKLGSLYGDDWFWRHLPDWVHGYYAALDTSIYPARRVTALNQLTQGEAEHVIRILEQIEYRNMQRAT